MLGQQVRRFVVIGVLAVMGWSVAADPSAQAVSGRSDAAIVYLPSITAEPKKGTNLSASIARASAQTSALHRPQKSCGKRALLGLGIGAGFGFILGTILAGGSGSGHAGAVIGSATEISALVGLVAALNTCR